MIEFEKWWKEKIKERSFPRCVARQPCEDTWKAALEWIQDSYKFARDGFDLGLWDMIKKELGEDKCRDPKKI